MNKSREYLLEVNEKNRKTLQNEEILLQSELKILNEQYNKIKERLQCIRIVETSIEIYGEKIDYTPYLTNESVIEISRKINEEITAVKEKQQAVDYLFDKGNEELNSLFNESNEQDKKEIEQQVKAEIWRELEENTEKLREIVRIQREEREKIREQQELELDLKKIADMERKEQHKKQKIDEEQLSIKEFYLEELKKKSDPLELIDDPIEIDTSEFIEEDE